MTPQTAWSRQGDQQGGKQSDVYTGGGNDITEGAPGRTRVGNDITEGL